MVTKLYEYMKKNTELYFHRVSFGVCELYHNEVIIFLKKGMAMIRNRRIIARRWRI